MKRRVFFIIVFSVLLLLAACSNGTTTEKSSLQLLDNANVGKYLADSNGRPLYYFTKDQPGISNCSGQCLVNWPAFAAKDFVVPKGFNKSDFSTIKREDNGLEQVTYKGYPLYYFIQDKAKGDVTGQGVGNVWYIINPQITFTNSSNY